MSRSRSRNVSSTLVWQLLAVGAVTAVVFVLVALALRPASPPLSAATEWSAENLATPQVESKPALSVIGDSFTGGSGEDSGEAARWTALVADDFSSIQALSEGGTGYVTSREVDGAATNYVTRSENIDPASDMVVFFGSVNDDRAGYDAVRAAADQAYANARSLAPEAELVVIGPASPWWPVPEGLLVARDAIRDAATAAGARWVDPIDQAWFEGAADLIGADGTHPNDAGHAYLADRIRETLAG